MRTRVRDERSVTELIVADNPGGVSRTSKYRAGLAGTIQSCTDQPDRNWAKARLRGEIVLHPCMISKTTRSFTDMSIDIRDVGGYLAHMSGDFAATIEPLMPPSLPGVNTSNLGLLALTAAYAGISSNQVMSGEIASDFGKTINTVRRPLEGLVKLLRKDWRYFALRRKTGSTGRRLNRKMVKELAKAELEIRYAMFPLISDATTALKNSATFSQRLNGTRMCSRSKRSTGGDGVITYTLVNVPNNNMRASGSVTSHLEVTSNAGVLYEIKNRSNLRQLLIDLSLTKESIVSTFWEVTPSSFIVDWAYNVGDWLAAVNLPQDVTVLGNWVTDVTDQTVKYNSTYLESIVHPVQYPAVGSWGSSEIHTRVMSRGVFLQLPSTPLLDLRFNSVTHAVDGVALLIPSIIRALSSH